MLINKKSTWQLLIILALGFSLLLNHVALAQSELPATGNPQISGGSGLQMTQSGLQPTSSNVLGAYDYQDPSTTGGDIKVETNYSPTQLTPGNNLPDNHQISKVSNGKIFSWLILGGGSLLGLALIVSLIKRFSSSTGGNVFTS